METQTKDSKLKKYFYLAVCSVLGVVLFVFICQLIIHLWLALTDAGVSSLSVSTANFDLITSILNILALGVGAWYGVWLGSYWYEKVYGKDSSGGFISHLSQKVTSGSENDRDSSWQMDDLFSLQKPSAKEEVQEEPKKKVTVKRTTATSGRARKVSAPKIQSTSPKKPVVPVKKRAATKRAVVS